MATPSSRSCHWATTGLAQQAPKLKPHPWIVPFKLSLLLSDSEFYLTLPDYLLWSPPPPPMIWLCLPTEHIEHLAIEIAWAIHPEAKTSLPRQCRAARNSNNGGCSCSNYNAPLARQACSRRSQELNLDAQVGSEMIMLLQAFSKTNLTIDLAEALGR